MQIENFFRTVFVIVNVLFVMDDLSVSLPTFNASDVSAIVSNCFTASDVCFVSNLRGSLKLLNLLDILSGLLGVNNNTFVYCLLLQAGRLSRVTNMYYYYQFLIIEINFSFDFVGVYEK